MKERQRAIISIDLDGGIYELSRLEELCIAIAEPMVKRIERLFQHPHGPLQELRQIVGLWFLKQRTVNPEAIGAIQWLHEQKKTLAEENKHLEIAVLTDRPSAARESTEERLKVVAHCIDRWLFNPFGSDPGPWKLIKAQELQKEGVLWYAHLDNERGIAVALAEIGSSNVYLLRSFATRLRKAPPNKNLILVDSCGEAARHFVDKVRAAAF